jgi:N-acetylglucosamine-6-phosphate deacetylase
MATLYPARFLGLDGRFGKLGPGYAPDLIGLSDQFELQFVVRNGRVVRP